MMNINVVKKDLFVKGYSVIIEMVSFLDKHNVHRLSGVRKLPDAVWVIPRQGNKLHRTYPRVDFM